MTREEIYDAEISPLMAQVIAVAKAHDIPMVAAFDLDDDRSIPEDDRPRLACITSMVPADAQGRMLDAHRALYPPAPGFLAITIHTVPR